MDAAAKTLKTCKNGHAFYKSSDCPVCPVCEKARTAKHGFLSLISAPARRALERKNIRSLEQLSKFTEKELLQLHGIGPSTIPTLKRALSEKKLTLKKVK